VPGEQRQSPKEIALAGYAAWNSGDLDTYLETVHPDIVWVSSGVFPGLRPSYEGHEGVREFWQAFTDAWESIEVEMVDIFELDEDSVLIIANFHARGRQGIEVDRPLANHLVMRDGKIWRQTAYAEWEKALAELGIEDPRGGVSTDS
jgi:ketosteroid isomerase-like protein